MKLQSPIHKKHARFEIIPLIDIMFFLLASFMMVSITMIRAASVRMDLPTPTASASGQKPAMIHIEVDAIGDVFIDKQRKTLPDLLTYLKQRHEAEPNIPAFIKGHPQATHGQLIAVLDLCRRAGIQKVSFPLTSTANRRTTP